LHNSHLEEIARRKPQSVHELGSVKGIGLRRAARYGEEILALVRGEEPASSQETDSTPPDYRPHLEAAKRLLRSGRGADAVPELARALEVGGEEVKKAVDDLLAP
jgi:ribonuclease D